MANLNYIAKMHIVLEMVERCCRTVRTSIVRLLLMVTSLPWKKRNTVKTGIYMYRYMAILQPIQKMSQPQLPPVLILMDQKL